MKKFIFLLALTAIGMPASAQPRISSPEKLHFAPFGQVTVYRATDKPNRVVIFISGDGGWNLGVVDMAKALARLDALVAGVDINQYRKSISRERSRCVYSAADFEALSQYLQQRYDFAQYRLPVLVGYSSGATMVYAVLLQSPPNTFAGGISLGFCPSLDTPKPLCRGSGLHHTTESKQPHTYDYRRASAISSPWVALQGTIDQVCYPPATRKFVQGIGNASVVMLPRVGHGFSVQRHWMPQFKQAYADILAHDAKRIGRSAKPVSLAGLPIIEKELAAPQGRPLAIIISGDGGWAGIDRQIGDELHREGINVVGLDSLRYFWSRKTPARAARDLGRILAFYTHKWDPSRVVVIGYSRGADVAPLMINRLPEAQRRQISRVALLGAGIRASLQFHLTDWFHDSKRTRDTYPIKPEIERMKVPKIFCFYGEDETADSVCPQLDPQKVTIVKTRGGHHFGGDYKLLAKQIMEALPQ